MRKFTLLLASVFAVAGLIAQDSCADALPVVADIVYEVDGVSGSEIPLPVCSTGGTGATAGMWYSYTPSETLLLTITTDLPGTGGTDTRLQVYTGTCGSLNCLAGDDDGGTGYTSYLNMQANAGTTYYIAFDNRFSSEGFHFQLLESEIGTVPFGFTLSGVSTLGGSMCAVDMNGDFLDDIVSVNASTVRINFQQPDGSFVTTNFSNDPVTFTPSWSIAAGDIDGNGYNDLMYGNGQGVAFMYANVDEETGILGYNPVEFPQYVFSQRGNFVDINMDGHLDAFMCHDVAPNVYYINDGGGNFTFFQGGLGNTSNGGNYGSIWIDYDNDCDIDLFIAKCRSVGNPASINQIHRNNGDGTFTEVGIETGLADGVQTWSSAWGDFDNDGDMDVFVGASSFTSAGNHKLMRNNGDGTFTEITEGTGLDTFNATSIEWITHDFNNDGYLDIFGGGNVIMFNNGDMTFSPTPVPISNGAIGDMNNDGFLDVVRSNGVYLNNGNNNNWVKVITVGTVSNKNGIGARVEVTSDTKTQIRDVRSGDGFKHMSSLNTHFGLGADDSIDKITVCWPSGLVSEIYNPSVNSTVVIVEEATTVGLFKPTQAQLVVYPNPAVDVLYMSSTHQINRHQAQIYDLSGKLVVNKSVINDQIDVSSLQAGVYLLRMVLDGEVVHQKFIKQ